MDKNLIKNAANPILFIAFCFEYQEYLKNPFSFKTYLPIQLDATCNGIQHLALFSQNTNLAELVNLFSSSYDKKPNDLYNITIKYINAEIDALKNLLNILI